MSVEFPDAVAWATDYLRTRLPANGYPRAQVFDRFNITAGEVVVLSRDGGPTLDVVRETARLRINCYSEGQDLTRVNALAQRVSSLLFDSLGAGPVRQVSRSSGPVVVPDVKPRVFMLFELTVVGSPVTLA